MPNSKLITCAEFQLFLDENPDYAPDHWEELRFPNGEGTKPILGLTPSAGQAFCDWLTRREGDSEWIYRLPEKGEADDGECCWQTNGDLVELSHPKIIEMVFRDWLIDPVDKISANLLAEKVWLNGYNTLALGLARTLARTLDRDLDLSLTLAHDRDHALAIAIGLDRDLARDRDLILALALAIGLDRARAHAHALARAHTLSLALAHDLSLAHAYDLIKELGNIYALIPTSDEYLRKLVDLFLRVGRIIKGYIELAMILDREYRSYSPVRLLRQWGEVDGFRREMLQGAIEHYEDQPRKVLNSLERITWKRELAELLRAYATLVMVEKRRTGEWQPFEGLRIVKARRKE